MVRKFKPEQRSEDELIRLALLYAAQDRVAYYDACRQAYPKDAQQALDDARQMTAYRIQRFGAHPHDTLFENAEEFVVTGTGLKRKPPTRERGVSR